MVHHHEDTICERQILNASMEEDNGSNLEEFREPSNSQNDQDIFDHFDNKRDDSNDKSSDESDSEDNNNHQVRKLFIYLLYNFFAFGIIEIRINKTILL